MSKASLLSFVLLALLTLLVGCSRATATLQPNTAPVESGNPQPGSTSTPVPPEATLAPPTPTITATWTATPEPLALRVNGEGISLAEFNVEMAQIQEAYQVLKKELPAGEQRQKVLDQLTGEALLAQAAFENGFQLMDDALQTEIERLAQQAGGQDALLAWQTQYGYTERAFRASLRRSMAAAWQRDQIAAGVPEMAEQVHARQIVVLDEALAQRALQQVKVPGADFENYAFGYDLQTGGDLGWFPRGYLLQPEVEEVAFTLQPGEISGVIQTRIGFHILKVIAREQRPLSPDARRYLQRQAVQDWLRARRDQSQVEVLLP